MNPEQRAEFREFVRTHHPDRGGDPEVFKAGMARFASLSADPPTAHNDDPRFDAPIEVVAPMPVPLRVAVALIRTVRWHRRNRRVT